jgi:PAS domain S-box-containing protein
MIQVLASAVQFLPEAVLLTEADPASHRVIFANQAFERLSGYSFDELKEKGLVLLQGPKTDHAVLQQLVESSQEEGEPADVLLYRKNGTFFRDRVRLCPMRVKNKLYHIQVHSDVTQQKETEARFILSQKREAASHLVSGLAHDFNNLLTAILVYCGLSASKHPGDAQLHRYLEEIRGSAERGAQLVAQLLNLGREDAAEPEIVDLRELVDQTCDLLKRVLGEDIRLTVQSDARLWKVRVHPGRIQQVLLNLAINARDAMPRGGDLVIQLLNHQLKACPNFPEAAPGRYVLLVVSDTGMGMDNETLANLFKPFFSTKEKGQGTGLGLFTACTILDQYGGHIHVSSNPGQGTTFKILLPAAPEAEPTSGSKATILLVEDDEVVRRSLDTTLSLRGYEILVAASASEALKLSLAHAGEIQLLLTDLVMPSLNGVELALKIQQVRPEIKVLFMSGYGNDPRRSGIQLEGTLDLASNFIKKPFTPALLVEKIEELLKK